MDRKTLNSLAQELRSRRKALLKEVADTEADLQLLVESRESELEERAQDERISQLLSRLDNRGKRELEEIDAARERIDEGRYGICTSCGKPIAVARLKALPATPLCLSCARKAEGRPPVVEETEEAEDTPRSGSIPADLSSLTDREIEQELRDRVRDDGRVDMEELRLVCRHGVVHLDGRVPSEPEHQILLKLMTDVAGFEEVVDRVQVEEILWQREDRSKEPPPEGGQPPAPELESPTTDDVVKSEEEGLEYEPPVDPPPEEEER